MRRLLVITVIVLVFAGLVLSAASCKQVDPDEDETKAIALQFFDAVFNTRDATLASSLLGPTQTYGYITPAIVESTIQDFKKKACGTVEGSVTVGKPSAEVVVPAVSDADAARGVTARTAWVVASKYRCPGMGSEADHNTLVFLEKINGKWCIAKGEMWYGTAYW
jgi:hypothetical protein